jgi:predicted ATPase
MLTEIRYQNFRALTDATLRLSPFTLIVGPNGSGKSTALQAFGAVQAASDPNVTNRFGTLVSLEVKHDPAAEVQLTFTSDDGSALVRHWYRDDAKQRAYTQSIRGQQSAGWSAVASARTFFLDSKAISEATQVKLANELGQDGSGLAGVLQDLRDRHP